MLTFVALGFGLGLLAYPWVSPHRGDLTMSQELARQGLLLVVTFLVAARARLRVRVTRIPLVLPAVVVVVACLTIRATVFLDRPFVPGDEDEYLFQARIFAEGHLTAPAPRDPERYWAPGLLVHRGRWFGHHQPGHALVLALGQWVGKPSLVPAVLSGLTLWWVGSCAGHLAGPQAGALTALLGMTSPMLLLTGSSLVSETSSLALVALVAWLLMARPLGARSPVVAGLVLGVLLNTRLPTALAAAVAGAILARRHAPALLPGLALGCVALVVHNALTTGDPFTMPFTLYEPHPLGFHRSFGPAQAVRHVLRNLVLLNSWLLGWPCSFLLIPMALARSRHLTLAAAGFTVCLVAVNALYWHPGQVATGPLRLHETWFFLILLAGLGWDRVGAGDGLLARYVPVALVVAHVGFVPVREAVLARFVRQVHAPRMAAEAFVGRVGAVAFVGRGDLFHYPVNDPWLREPTRQVRDLEGPGLEVVQDCLGRHCRWWLAWNPGR